VCNLCPYNIRSKLPFVAVLFVPGAILTIGTGFAFGRAFDSAAQGVALASTVSAIFVCAPGNLFCIASHKTSTCTTWCNGASRLFISTKRQSSLALVAVPFAHFFWEGMMGCFMDSFNFFLSFVSLLQWILTALYMLSPGCEDRYLFRDCVMNLASKYPVFQAIDRGELAGRYSR